MNVLNESHVYYAAYLLFYQRLSFIKFTIEYNEHYKCLYNKFCCVNIINIEEIMNNIACGHSAIRCERAVAKF